MLKRRFWGVTIASLALSVLGASSGWAVERQLVGIVLGRSFKTVLAKYGTPDQVTPVVLPTASTLMASGSGLGLEGLFPGQGLGGGYPGGPGGSGPGGYPGSSPYGPGGMGGPGGPPGGPGGSPYGGPGMGGPGGPPGGPGGSPYGGPGMGGPGAPPVLPPGGEGGGSPYGGPGGGPGGYGGGADASAGGAQGNAVKWAYVRPNGGLLEFWINEDGRVAQIAAAGRTGSAVTSKAIKLGSPYSQVVRAYGVPETSKKSPVPPEVATVMGLGRSKQDQARRNRLTGYAQIYSAPGVQTTVTTLFSVDELLYPRTHHAAFTVLDGKVVRVTIALAD